VRPKRGPTPGVRRPACTSSAARAGARRHVAARDDDRLDLAHSPGRYSAHSAPSSTARLATSTLGYEPMPRSTHTRGRVRVGRAAALEAQHAAERRAVVAIEHLAHLGVLGRLVAPALSSQSPSLAGRLKTADRASCKDLYPGHEPRHFACKVVDVECGPGLRRTTPAVASALRPNNVLTIRRSASASGCGTVVVINGSPGLGASLGRPRNWEPNAP
jgi:hypothetical protein